MARILALAATAAAVLLCCVSASGLGLFGGGVYAELRTVDDFNRIEVRGPADVVVRRAWNGILTVRGRRDRVADVVNRVESGTLFVEGGRRPRRGGRADAVVGRRAGRRLRPGPRG